MTETYARTIRGLFRQHRNALKRGDLTLSAVSLCVMQQAIETRATALASSRAFRARIQAKWSELARA